MNTAIANASAAPRAPGKALNIALWVVQVLAGLMFLFAGGHKLTGDPQMVGLFQTLGLGQWFRYFTGALEVIGGVLLFVPRASGLGAALLIPVMLGAVATHLFVIGAASVGPAAALLVAVAFVAWGRRAQIKSVLERISD